MAKRLDEAFGPKTDFSVSNFENNYDKLNKEEQEILVKKMQDEFNNQGYTDADGYKLKSDGVFGKKTESVYKQYKKDNAKELENVTSEMLNKGLTNTTLNSYLESYYSKSNLNTGKGITQKVKSNNISNYEISKYEKYKDSSKNNFEKFANDNSTFCGNVMSEIMANKVLYIKAKQQGDAKQMAKSAEIGKFLKAVLRETAQYQDVSTGRILKSLLEYDENNDDFQGSLLRWDYAIDIIDSYKDIDEFNALKAMKDGPVLQCLKIISDGVDKNQFEFNIHNLDSAIEYKDFGNNEGAIYTTEGDGIFKMKGYSSAEDVTLGNYDIDVFK